jgi:hypothetical protein
LLEQCGLGVERLILVELQQAALDLHDLFCPCVACSLLGENLAGLVEVAEVVRGEGAGAAVRAKPAGTRSI